MKKTILVIGATGLLGESVPRHLLQNGFQVKILVRDPGKAKKQFGDPFEIVKGDVMDIDSLENAGCFGIHINTLGEIEQVGTENIVKTAVNFILE